MNINFFAGARRLLFLASIGSATLLTTACQKDAEPVVAQDYSAIDEGLIKNYLAANTITTAQRQPSGLYFLPVVTNPNAVRAAGGSTVNVLYTGRLLDGSVFDASSQHNNVPIQFVLGIGNVIKGWDEGIALMHKGDKAELLIPSGLAYGPASRGSIPSNAVLRFEVELVNVR